MQQIDGMQIEVDMRQEVIEWRIQRFAWAVFALIVLAAILGLMGSGLLGHAQAGSPSDPIWIEYFRFGRRDAPEPMTLHINRSPSIVNGGFELSVNRTYIERHQVRAISPQPKSIAVHDGQMIYTFDAVGNDTFAVTFTLQPNDVGNQSAEIGLPGQPPLHIGQFVYP